MLYLNLLKLAVRNTRRRGKRTWLTMIGVIIGVTAIISLVALGQGLEQAIVQEFEDLGANFVVVDPLGDSITDDDMRVVERAPGVGETIGMYMSTSRVSHQGDEESLNIFGVRGDQFSEFKQAQALSVDEGRELRSNDLTNIIIGPNVKEDTFEQELDIRSQIQVEGGNSFNVVGVLEDSGDPRFQEAIIMDLEQARDIFDADDELSGIMAEVQPGFEVEEVQENIEEEMRRDRELEEGEEDFSTTTPDDILDALTGILGVVQGIVVGIASIALFVGGIGIMNTTYMSISERTQEIGTMKAIGAKKRHISALFVFESGLIGMIGSLIGLIIGLGISNISIYLIDTYTDFAAVQVYSPELAIGAVAFGFILGVLSGLLPARKAANMKPVQALRYE